MQYTPEIVQVVPFEDHTVSVYFSDGKIVSYDVKPKLNSGIFRMLRDLDVFMNACSIINNTLAWDIDGNHNPTTCIDIAPDTLYALPDSVDRIA